MTSTSTEHYRAPAETLPLIPAEHRHVLEAPCVRCDRMHWVRFGEGLCRGCGGTVEIPAGATS